MKNPSLAFLLIVAFVSLFPSVTQAQYYIESPTQYTYGSTLHPVAGHSFQPVGQVVAMESNSVVWASPYQTPISPQIQSPIVNESIGYATPANSLTPSYSSIPAGSNLAVTSQSPVYSAPQKVYSVPQFPAVQSHAPICTTGG